MFKKQLEFALASGNNVLDYLQWGPDYYIPPDFLIYFLVCTAQTTKSMKTNDIPLKSPIKLQQEMQKEIWIFRNLLDF